MIHSHTLPCLTPFKILGLGLLLSLSVILFARPLAARPIATKQQVNPNTILPDGIYLYGQSARPDQIGREYLVFRSDRGRIRGAIYYPQSEFNCFTGNLGDRNLKLAVLDPETQKAYPYSIALTASPPIANRQAQGYNLALDGYQPLATLSANDRRMLDICLGSP